MLINQIASGLNHLNSIENWARKCKIKFKDKSVHKTFTQEITLPNCIPV